MKNEVLIALVLLAGCSSVPASSKPRQQITPTEPLVTMPQERPPIGGNTQDRWYQPENVESEQSWKIYKQLYLNAERFRIAYDALHRSDTLHLLEANEELLSDYEQATKLAPTLRPHFFEAFTFVDNDIMQRFDSREIYRIENDVMNNPVGPNKQLPDNMFNLYQRIQSLSDEYKYEKNKVTTGIIADPQ